MKPPPEEKLLRLIRGKDPKPAASTVSAAASHPMPTAVLRFGEVAAQGRTRRWPRIAAVTLSALIGLEAAYLLLQLMRPFPVIQVPVVPTVPTPPPITSEAGTSPAPLPDMPSLAASAARPLFASPVHVMGSALPSGAAPSAAVKTLAARLSLMGIVAGNPAQAIIEDAQTKKTYFVTVGQMVVDGAVLQSVLDHRVILELEGEKIELTL